MEVIYMLICISIAVALIFFFLFIRAIRKGQYDDSHTPAIRMLFEDELVDQQKQKNILETEKLTDKTN